MLGRRRRAHEIVVFLTRRGRAEILVARRCSELGGFWHPISGSCDPGESPKQAAVREVLEETGFDVTTALVGAPSTTYSYRRDGNLIRVRCFLVMVDEAFAPVLNWEHSEARWCTPVEADDMLAWRNVADALGELLDDEGGQAAGRPVRNVWMRRKLRRPT